MGGNDTCSWDEAKREKVFRERGIDFDELGRFFLDPGALTVEDKRRDYGEPRYNMLGKHQGLVLNMRCSASIWKRNRRRRAKARLVSSEPCRPRPRAPSTRCPLSTGSPSGLDLVRQLSYGSRPWWRLVRQLGPIPTVVSPAAI